MGTNRKIVKDEGTGEESHKHVKREYDKYDELFQSFTNEERWNNMCIENKSSKKQVFDEYTNDEEKEQDEKEPIAEIGQVRDFISLLCFYYSHECKTL